jgi:two-component system, sensor histidine kinase and response regulator
MNRKAGAIESLSQLRHGLRTPLNHVIGYAEILLEDAIEFEKSESVEVLRALLAEAQALCDTIQITPVRGDAPERIQSEVESLRSGMRQRLPKMLHLLGSMDGLHKPDVERIATALHELQSFADTGELASVRSEIVSTVPEPFRESVIPSARLLVVDDDPANRDVLQRHLERQGHEVEQAEGGREALQKLRGSTFDAVLLDLMMPELNGLEVLKAMQEDPNLRNLPVLVISASDELGLVAESIHGGAEDYLFKPFDPVLLRARLLATLERKRLRDQERSRSLELERVTAALQRSNEDLRWFAYAASHDLQAPVRTINAFLQLLERRTKDRLSLEDAELIKFATEAASRMSTLIHDLLQYSHASTTESHPEAIDCDSVLKDVVGDLRSLIEETSASVSWRSLPTVIVDATALRQLLQNLITNAIKYRREDEAPVVLVAAAQKGDFWEFSVQDNGQGIAREHCSRIFEMFQRLHGAEVPGSGLGLAMCQRIIDRLGGTIWVDSVPGQGSTFCFTVPVVTAGC